MLQTNSTGDTSLSALVSLGGANFMTCLCAGIKEVNRCLWNFSSVPQLRALLSSFLQMSLGPLSCAVLHRFHPRKDAPIDGYTYTCVPWAQPVV